MEKGGGTLGRRGVGGTDRNIPLALPAVAMELLSERLAVIGCALLSVAESDEALL